ncbi:two-component system, NtrC family, C4-dicarboxylate transport response regulator DctD [Oryzomicrobium terrae]|uniref:Two-component system, NtrC family, C4-dicarboxylate transport response regulator DctD n=1 Tax=Oryzomicrobium terrae TaxID=1735038 RepID=A0A5C1EA87_9RHOO|nr:sigma-54 dependent transcriptional regulator [Oryzomicrobium terrae]QEL65832.1 two-component system, NtrC family, C4-dicarboxylate transport response regulator DctD [Oryzomicrobium terrae]
MSALSVHADPAAPLSVFLVEDDPVVRHGSEQALALADLPVQSFADAESALNALVVAPSARSVGVVISDVRLPGRDGLSLMTELRQRDPDLPVILVTGHGDVAMAVEAMREGAYDFIEKPFSSDRLVDSARRALDKRALILENRRLKERLADQDNHPLAGLIGQSPAMQQVRRLLEAVAPTDVDVLINGETGAGKEVVARALHAASGRKGPFVALNCGALPESVFESEIFGHEAGAFTGAGKRRIGKIEFAQGGTLFLDEIESMPLALQVKLLRVLQERVVERLGGNTLFPVDCRVVAASKADLKAESDAGRFRADLYYRLNVVTLDLAPLRERREDIPLLMAHFCRQAAQRYGRPVPAPSPEQLARWQAYDWPGNVRELKNIADRVVLGLETPLPAAAAPHAMTAAAAPALPPAAPGESLAARLDAVEKACIEAALKECGGQVARAAERLQLPKKTLYDKLHRHGIDPERFRS